MKVNIWTMTGIGFLLIIFLCIGLGSAQYTLTNQITAVEATAPYAKNVTLHGHTYSDNLTYWWEYGRRTNMQPYPFKTENVTGGGNFSLLIEGLPLMSGQAFYGRLCNETVCSVSEVSWTMAASALVPAQTNAVAYQTLVSGNKFNLSKMPFTVMSPYTDLMGNQLVWGLIFAFIFFAYWFMTETIEIPVILGLISSGSILYAGTLSLGIPPEFVNIAQALMIVSVIGLAYVLLRRR